VRKRGQVAIQRLLGKAVKTGGRKPKKSYARPRTSLPRRFPPTGPTSGSTTARARSTT
jgi:hypothetical protein